jgi:hypothetical protein
MDLNLRVRGKTYFQDVGGEGREAYALIYCFDSVLAWW